MARLRGDERPQEHGRLEFVPGGQQMTEPVDLKVFITAGESTCSECGEELGRHAWITLAGERGALCLA